MKRMPPRWRAWAAGSPVAEHVDYCFVVVVLAAPFFGAGLEFRASFGGLPWRATDRGAIAIAGGRAAGRIAGGAGRARGRTGGGALGGAGLLSLCDRRERQRARE